MVRPGLVGPSLEIAQGPAAPQSADGAPAMAQTSLLPVSMFPPAALYYAIALTGIVAIRTHELIAFVSFVRPALTLSLLAVAAVVFRATPRARTVAMRDIAFLLTVAYWGWALITSPLSLWRSASITFAVSTSIPGIVLVLATLLAPPTQRSIDRMQVAFVAFACIHIVGLRFLGNDGNFGRLSGSGAFDSNDLASIAAITFPFAITLLLRQKGWARVLGLAGAALTLASMEWFNSRGGTLAMAAGILTLVLLQPGRRRWAMLGLVLVGGTAFWLTASSEYRGRITGMTDLKDDYNLTDYYGRQQVWARARRYIRENPITGVGINAFPVMEGLTLKAMGKGGKWSATHNAYLQAYAELGVPGGTIFVFLLGTGLVRAYRLARPKDRAGGAAGSRPELLASLVAFCSGAYFLSHAYFYAAFALIAMIGLATFVAARQSAGVPASAPVSIRATGTRQARLARAR
jgi:O-antigen ligase